jgi:CheY-like chemotaxis protein
MILDSSDRCRLSHLFGLRAASIHPNVLICDLAMPGMDGYELLENVRALEPELGQTPAIAFTAAATNIDQARAQQAGFKAHLAKPIDPNKLVKTILEVG